MPGWHIEKCAEHTTAGNKAEGKEGLLLVRCGLFVWRSLWTLIRFDRCRFWRETESLCLCSRLIYQPR